MRQVFLCLLMFAGAMRAQFIPAPAVYQAGLANGVIYIAPPVGTAIINQHVSENWKTVLAQIGGDTSIAGAVFGIAGTVSMTKQWELALTAAHEGFVLAQKWLQNTAPSGTSQISPVLQMNGAVGNGSENTIFASSFMGADFKTVKRALKSRRLAASTPLTVSTEIKGLRVSYTAQGVQTQLIAAGAKIKDFIIVDVLVSDPSVK